MRSVLWSTSLALSLLLSIAPPSLAQTGAMVERDDGSAPLMVFVGVSSDALTDAERRDLSQRVGEDLDTRLGFNLLYGSALFEQAPLSPDELKFCVTDDSCLREFGDALGADVVLHTSVDEIAGEYHIRSRHLGTAQDDALRERQTVAPKAALEMAEAVRLLNAHLVLPYSNGTKVAAEFALSEDDATLIVDGTQYDGDPSHVMVVEGVHVVRAEKPGFIPLERYIDIQDSKRYAELTLVPTEAFKDDFLVGAWIWRGLSFAALGGGVLLIALGVGTGVLSYFAAQFVSTAIQSHNADPNRDAAGAETLLLQTRIVNFGLTPGAAVMGVVGAATVIVGGAIFLLADSPSRYE